MQVDKKTGKSHSETGKRKQERGEVVNHDN